MTDKEAGYRWWIRHVIIPLIGGGGLVGIWLALRPDSSGEVRESPSPVTAPSVQALPDGQRSEQVKETQSDAAHQSDQSSSHDQRAEVESLVSRWLAAWRDGDMDAFMSLAGEPYYFDQRIVLTKVELRQVLDSLLRARGSDGQSSQISRIKVWTARELQETGIDMSRDRVFGNLNLTLDDYVVEVVTRNLDETHSMTVAVRRGSPPRIAGAWD